MLILSRKVDEQIKIGENITLTIIEVRGEQVKIGIEAPRSVKVFREEVLAAIQKENKLASNADAHALDSLSQFLEKK